MFTLIVFYLKIKYPARYLRTGHTTLPDGQETGILRETGRAVNNKNLPPEAKDAVVIFPPQMRSRESFPQQICSSSPNHTFPPNT